jgi:hypothetical protein
MVRSLVHKSNTPRLNANPIAGDPPASAVDRYHYTDRRSTRHITNYLSDMAAKMVAKPGNWRNNDNGRRDLRLTLNRGQPFQTGFATHDPRPRYCVDKRWNFRRGIP